MSDLFEKNWEELGKEWAKRKIEELQSSLDSSLSLLREQGKFIDNVDKALAKADELADACERDEISFCSRGHNTDKYIKAYQEARAKTK